MVQLSRTAILCGGGQDEGGGSSEEDRPGCRSSADGRVAPVEGAADGLYRQGLSSEGVDCVEVGVADLSAFAAGEVVALYVWMAWSWG